MRFLPGVRGLGGTWLVQRLESVLIRRTHSKSFRFGRVQVLNRKIDDKPTRRRIASDVINPHTPSLTTIIV